MAKLVAGTALLIGVLVGGTLSARAADLESFRASLAATAIGSEVRVTLNDGARLDGALAEIGADDFAIWIDADKETERRLGFARGKVKRRLSYNEVASLEGTVEVDSKNLGYRIREGDDVRVRATDGSVVGGRVESYDGDVLRVDDRSFRLSEGDVRQIELRMNDGLLDGTLIGFGVGAGLAALGCSDIGCDAGDFGVVCLIFCGAGAGLGALFDSLHNGLGVVFSSPSSPKGLLVMPLILGDRKGVLVSLRF